MALLTMRATAGFSQQALAAHLGLSKSQLCNVEKDRRAPRLEWAGMMAGLLGVPEARVVQMFLQAMVDAAGLHVTVDVKQD